MNIVFNRKQPSSRITDMASRSDANGRSVMRCSSRDHTYTGLKIDCGFDAQAVECTSSHCPVHPRQMSHSLQRLIDDIAVIDEPRDNRIGRISRISEELKLISLTRTVLSQGVRRSGSY